MNKNDYIIRLERREDHGKVENLVREAFWNIYRPGCLEHYVLHVMRDAVDFVPELAFVMAKVVLFMPVNSVSDTMVCPRGKMHPFSFAEN